MQKVAQDYEAVEAKMKFNTGQVVACFVLAIVQGVSVEADPIAWTGNGHYYELVESDGITWDSARSAAQGRTYLGVSGHLATITSAAEQDFIAQNVLPGQTTRPIYLLGGKQRADGAEPYGGWEWITGEPWGYTNWSWNNPNNDANQDVLAIYGNPSEALSYTYWDDYWAYTGTHTGGYIVEYPVPEAHDTLALSCTIGGTITMPGEGVFEYVRGTSVPIVAAVNAGYRFVNWTGTAVSAGKVADPTSASTTVTVSADYTMIANFVPHETPQTQHTLTISSTVGGNVVSPGEGVFQYAEGTTVSVGAEAESGFEFSGWTGTAVNAGKVAKPTSAYTEVAVDGDYTLVANFSAIVATKKWILRVSSGSGGDVYSPGEGRFEYDDGSYVQLEARADSGYQFTNWSGGIYTTANPTMIQMTSNLSIRADFEPDKPAVPSTIKGLVIRVDAQGRSKGPLAGATVSLSEAAKKTATTDSQGEFTFTELSAGTFTVAVSKSGYYSETRSVKLSQGDTRSETFKLTAQSAEPSAFDFSSPNGKYFIEGLPGNIKFSVLVAWNGTPGAVRFNVAGSWRQAIVTDLGGGKAQATLTVSVPVAVSTCSELTIEVKNGDGKTTTIGTGVRFGPMPGILAPWYGDDIPWSAGMSYKVQTDAPLSLLPEDLHLGPLKIEDAYRQTKAVRYDPWAGQLSGQMDWSLVLKFQTGYNPVFGRLVRFLGEAKGTGGGELSISFGDCTSPPRLTPSWHFGVSGKAGVGVPTVVFVEVLVPPVSPAIHTLLAIPVIGRVVGALETRVFLVLGADWTGVYGSYPGVVTGDKFLWAKRIDGTFTGGLEIQSALELYGASVGVYGGGTATCPIAVPVKIRNVEGYVGVFAAYKLYKYDKRWGVVFSFDDVSAQSLDSLNRTDHTLHNLQGQSIRLVEIANPDDPISWEPIGDSMLEWGQANHLTVSDSEGKIAIQSSQEDSNAEEVVLENVGSLAAPSVLSDESGTVILFSLHDPNKSWSAATDIGVAVRQHDKPWSLDRIADDERAEFDPKVAEADLPLIAWTRVSDDISGTSSPDEVMPHLEIVTSRVNQGMGPWGIPEQITSNSVVDRDPLPITFGQKEGILWIQNQGEASIGDTNSGDQLVFAGWDGLTWGMPQTLWSDSKGIIDFTFTEDGAGQGHVVLSVDEDGDLTTATDCELYYVSTVDGVWQPAVRLTENTIEDSSPVVISPSGMATCVWDANGIVTYSLVEDWNPRAICTGAMDANDHCILEGVTLPSGGAIVYTLQKASGTDIYASFYDVDTDLWSLPRQLTHDESVESSLSLTHDENNLLIAYLKTRTLRTGMDIEIDGQTVHLEDVPQPGRVDLCMLRYSVGHDMAVAGGSLMMEPETPAPGQMAIVSAIIENQGDLLVKNATLTFYDGDPAVGGIVIGDPQNIPEVLVGGETKRISILWCVPTDDRSHEVFVVVDAGPNIDDRDSTNDVASLSSMMADLTIETCWSDDIWGRQVALTARIVNTGVVSCGAFDVSWRLNNPNGFEIGRRTIDGITAHATYEAAFTWDMRDLVEPGQSVQVFAIADAEQRIAEVDEANNVASCVVYVEAGGGEEQQESMLPPSLAYWTFDEGNGTQAKDSIKDRSAEVRGATWILGVIRNALSFDGIDDYVDCGRPADLAPEKLTIAVWMQAGSFEKDMYLVGKGSFVAADRDYALAVKSDATVEFFFGETAENLVRLRGATPAIAGEWTHVAATRDGSRACVYVNGKSDASVIYSFTSSDKGQSMKIGAYGFAPWGCFNGAIDDVRIYGLAFTAEEVQTLYDESLR